MAKQDLSKLLSQSAARSVPVEIRRGKGVGLSVEGQEPRDANASEPQVMWVDVERLLDNPYQHAEEIDAEEYAALVESIKVDGFQGALNVSPMEGREGFYFITSGGHQRRDAARDAGVRKLPVFVSVSPAEKRQLGLRLARENTTQVNRSPVNLGFLYIQLIEEFGMTQEEIASAIKKDRYHVNFAIMAARSAADIRAALREKYSPRVMTYLRRLGDAEQRAPIIAGYLEGRLTVEGVRVVVEQVQAENRRREVSSAEADAKLPLRRADPKGRFGESLQGGTRDSSSEQGAVTNGQEAFLHESDALRSREGAVTDGQEERPSARVPYEAQHESRALDTSLVMMGEGKRWNEQNEQEVSLLQQVKEANTNVAPVIQDAAPRVDHETLERTSKVQAAFNRVETYRRYIEKRRADGEAIQLSPQEAVLLGKIIDRCHTLLDTYGEQ